MDIDSITSAASHWGFSNEIEGAGGLRNWAEEVKQETFLDGYVSPERITLATAASNLPQHEYHSHWQNTGYTPPSDSATTAGSLGSRTPSVDSGVDMRRSTTHSGTFGPGPSFYSSSSSSPGVGPGPSFYSSSSSSPGVASPLAPVNAPGGKRKRSDGSVPVASNAKRVRMRAPAPRPINTGVRRVKGPQATLRHQQDMEGRIPKRRGARSRK